VKHQIFKNILISDFTTVYGSKTMQNYRLMNQGGGSKFLVEPGG